MLNYALSTIVASQPINSLYAAFGECADVAMRGCSRSARWLGGEPEQAHIIHLSCRDLGAESVYIASF